LDTELGSILSEETVETPDAEVEQPPEPEVVAEPGEETTATPAAEAQEDPIEKHRKGLEAAVIAERRKRQELEHRLEQLQRPPPAQPAATEQEPKQADYTDQAEYFRALVRFEAKQLHQAERAEQAREQQQREEQDQASKFQRTAAEVIAKGQAKYQDFDAVINGGLAPYLNPVMQQALVIGGGHEVAYWLAKNPAEAARVSELPPMEMVLEIGRLEAKVKQAEEPPKQSIPQTLTQARDARTGQFAPVYDGPTPLDEIVKRR
jgi:hypothetical protein